MMAIPRNQSKSTRVLRLTARALFLLWAAFWIFFNLASGVSETVELGLMALIMHLFMPLVALITLYFVWREELLGGVLLLLEAALYTYFFHTREWFMLLTLPLPLVVSGVLLLMCGMNGKRHRAKPQLA
jgi:hypothetical protein